METLQYHQVWLHLYQDEYNLIALDQKSIAIIGEGILENKTNILIHDTQKMDVVNITVGRINPVALRLATLEESVGL